MCGWFGSSSTSPCPVSGTRSGCASRSRSSPPLRPSTSCTCHGRVGATPPRSRASRSHPGVPRAPGGVASALAVVLMVLRPHRDPACPAADPRGRPMRSRAGRSMPVGRSSPRSSRSRSCPSSASSRQPVILFGAASRSDRRLPVFLQQLPRRYSRLRTLRVPPSQRSLDCHRGRSSLEAGFAIGSLRIRVRPARCFCVGLTLPFEGITPLYFLLIQMGILIPPAIALAAHRSVHAHCRVRCGHIFRQHGPTEDPEAAKSMARSWAVLRYTCRLPVPPWRRSGFSPSCSGP